MLNSGFANEQARALAARLRGQSGDLLSKARSALCLVTQHEPDSAEVRTAAELLKRLQTEAGLDEAKALDRLALMAINLNEFLYLD
jgi:hypothetical protein